MKHSVPYTDGGEPEFVQEICSDVIGEVSCFLRIAPSSSQLSNQLLETTQPLKHFKQLQACRKGLDRIQL